MELRESRRRLSPLPRLSAVAKLIRVSASFEVEFDILQWRDVA